MDDAAPPYDLPQDVDELLRLAKALKAAGFVPTSLACGRVHVSLQPTVSAADELAASLGEGEADASRSKLRRALGV